MHTGSKLNPPERIKGKLGNAQHDALRERALWVNGLPDSATVAQVASALGISKTMVLNIAPGKFSKANQFLGEGDRRSRVTMPTLPIAIPPKTRDETAPRAGIVSTADDDRPATVGFVLRHLRSLCDEAAA